MVKLTEKDKLTDILMLEKEIVKNYSTMITESSTIELRNLLKQFHDETSDDQFVVFEKMSERNYYNTKTAEPTEIMQETSKFENMKNQLSDLKK